MLIQFQKEKCKWSTAELRQIIRYTLQAGFSYLPFSDYLSEEGLQPEFAVTFIGADALRSLNKEQRGIDKVTDVLSFPMLAMKKGALEEHLTAADINPENNSVFLGDIVICLDRAEEQALEFNHTMQREVAFLTLHSMLHLVGYDHVDNETDRLEMEEIQRELLDNLGIKREMTSEQIIKLITTNLKRLNEIENDYSEQKMWAETDQAAFDPLSGELSATDVSTNLNDGEPILSETRSVQGKQEQECLLKPEGEQEQQLIKSGFVSIVGRPNAGKSTLLNAISGQHLAIVSRKAQTTRNNIRSIYNARGVQMIFIDTPGLHEPDTELGKYMQEAAKKALSNSDILLLMIDACKAGPTSIEENCLKTAQSLRLPTVIAFNKIDLIDKSALLPVLNRYRQLAPQAEIIPISAKLSDGVGELLRVLTGLLPTGPRYYPVDSFTDQSERQIAGEMIREQLLIYTHEEVPHGTAVIIDSFEEVAAENSTDPYDRSLVRIHASILCDKESHKGIIIGKGGQSLKRIGSAARHNIEKMLDCKVYLELHVKVRPDWRNRRGILQELGYQNKD